MADRKLSRAQAGLALASALVVLLASGVAIIRLSDPDDHTPSATGPESTSPATGAPAEPDPTLTGPGTEESGGPGVVAGTAPGSDQVASGPTPAAVTRRAQRSAAAGVGDSGAPAAPVGSPAGAAVSGASGSDGTPGSEVSGGPPGSGPSSGSGTPGPDGAADGGGPGAPPGGGQDSPPAPSQEPSEPEALASAAVSVGQGSRGGVVAVRIVDSMPEVDVTVGTTQLVGDHPPAQGTGVTFGGRFLQPPPTSPTLPG